MTELTGMNPAELTAWVKEQGLPGFRGKQIFRWIHQGQFCTHRLYLLS